MRKDVVICFPSTNPSSKRTNPLYQHICAHFKLHIFGRLPNQILLILFNKNLRASYINHFINATIHKSSFGIQLLKSQILYNSHSQHCTNSDHSYNRGKDLIRINAWFLHVPWSNFVSLNVPVNIFVQFINPSATK